MKQLISQAMEIFPNEDQVPKESRNVTEAINYCTEIYWKKAPIKQQSLDNFIKKFHTLIPY